MNNTRLMRAAGAVLAVCALTLGTQLPASAGVNDLTIPDVNCDALWRTASVSYNHTSSSAPMNLRNNSTTPWSIVYFAWRSATSGNTLAAKGPIAPNSRTSNWTNVAIGWYYPMVRRDNPSNCNGAFPGNGTFSIFLTATY